MSNPTELPDLDKLEALAQAANPGPWEWWTSNSILRLSAADGIDGGVLHAYSHRGISDICCGTSDRAFIAAANPAAVLALIALARRAQPASEATQTACTVPPEGWYCTRAPGRDGPCAAWPVAQQAAAPGALDDLAALRRLIECAEILDKRPRPMCRDCADEDGTCPNSGLECDMRALLAKTKALYNRLAATPSAPGTPEAPKQPAHGHRDDYYLLANGRRLGLEPISRVRTMPNWVLAMELFATGSTSAHQICRDAGIDPDSTTIQRAAQLDGGQEGSAT